MVLDLKELAAQFISSHGYTGLYLYFVLDTLGVLLPSKSILTLIGFFVERGILSFVPVVITAVLGSLTGVSVSYFIGRKIGNPFFEKYGRFISVTPEKLLKAEAWAGRYGAPAIVLAYFVPGLRHITPYLSGITRLPYWKVMFFSAAGALLWVTVFINLGLFLGDIWDRNAGN
ncbi:DedA family protein [Pelotomaculum sp. PtaB.Bin117]|uniref:DedA family protein n=2 Tax=Pelotomaculum TaxID=191373 RepID=UPI0009D069A2|nr:DedA family protein [Pelotomaculum sp. PtaB.Bin117]OPX84056.1 MAG: Inner membrane protein YghB [Pelotomaculum sp. PtaB.Bin117]